MRFWKFNKAKAPSPQPAPPKNQEQIIGDKADVDIQIGTAIAGMKTLDELDSLRLYLIDQYPSRSDFIKRATNDRRARISEAEKKRKEQADRNPAPPPPPPQPLPQSSVHVGEVIESTDRRKPRHLRLDAKLRNRHLYLIGKTRTGKTTLIKNLLIQDMEEGRGVGFIDPHGDAALELLGNVPQSRVNDVIYFDPTSEFSPAFNPLQLPYSPPKLAEDMISVFKMFFGDSWGFRLEHLLRYALLTLIADKEPRTVRDLRSIFLNEKLRTRFTQNLTNQSLIEFWENEFPTMPKGSTLPIINKLSAFLAPMSDLERIFSTPQNDLNFSDILNSQKIFIANLAKGQLGDEPSRLLGGFITTGIQQAALARATIPPEDRKDFYFYVDEFQNYTVSSFETILAESAKYRLNLTLANQQLGQIPQALQRGIFGNVATLVSFQISAEDAPHLRKEMHQSRIACRKKQERDYISLKDFTKTQVQELTDEYERHTIHRQHITPDRTYNVSWPMEKAVEAKDKIEKLISMQNSPNHKTLKELFPDYEFRSLDYPDVDDFINLKPYHAFCRVERADNVYALRTLPAPDPNGETRKQILQLATAKRKEHEAKEPAEEKPNPQNPQKKEDDYWV